MEYPLFRELRRFLIGNTETVDEVWEFGLRANARAYLLAVI